MKNCSWLGLLLVWLICAPAANVSASTVQEEDALSLWGDAATEDGEETAASTETISDPLETFNRASLHFNDWIYFGFLRPTATLYSAVVPETIRVGGRHFFHNLATPKHVVSALLQGKLKQSGVELTRFVVNTLAGGLGMFDVAEQIGLKSANEDIGQAMATYGASDRFYLVLPLLGPSNGRDALGWIGDTLLDPVAHLSGNGWTTVGVPASRVVNEASLHAGEYEALRKASLDPYIALRDAYLQRRATQIQE